MNQAFSAAPGAAPAKLMQYLSHAGAPVSTDKLPCLAERLSRLFGLGDTMSLDAAQAHRSRQPGAPQAGTVENLVKELANTRRILVKRLREYGHDVEAAEKPGPEPYINALLATQRKIAATTRQLRDKVRKSMKDQGQTLARLAEMDAVFDHTMASYTGQCFAQIPRVLEQRFQSLRSSFEQDSGSEADPENWLHRYCEEAQNLLLAELDVRLEPILGLLEACHNEVSHTQ
ncbi:MAG: DUF3348 family protein [Gammaproteobacteria bacterium]|nr:MAG: DUF3348 family protein [Gammaproteobacteria bacterium]